MNSEFSLFYTTWPDEKTAQEAGRVLLEEKLIACTNLLSGMQSQCRWEGKIERAQECILILKTESRLKEPLQERLESLHPYQVPCFLELKIESGNPLYLNWLRDSLK